MEYENVMENELQENDQRNSQEDENADQRYSNVYQRDAIQGEGRGLLNSYNDGAQLSLVSKMGQLLMQKTFLPTGNHIKQALQYLDMTIKCEIVLNELSSSLFWCSLLEVLLFIFLFFLFLRDVKELGLIWLHVPHVLRGLIGYILMKRLPNSYEMAQQMSIPGPERMPFEKIMGYILRAAKDALDSFTNQTKKFLIVYILMTTLCLILDFISFFSKLGSFGDDSAQSDLMVIVAACVFLFTDWFYVLWIVSLVYKFPSYANFAFVRSLLGMMDSIHELIGKKLKERKQAANSQFQSNLDKYNYINQS